MAFASFPVVALSLDGNDIRVRVVLKSGEDYHPIDFYEKGRKHTAMARIEARGHVSEYGSTWWEDARYFMRRDAGMRSLDLEETRAAARTLGKVHTYAAKRPAPEHFSHFVADFAKALGLGEKYALARHPGTYDEHDGPILFGDHGHLRSWLVHAEQARQLQAVRDRGAWQAAVDCARWDWSADAWAGMGPTHKPEDRDAALKEFRVPGGDDFARMCALAFDLSYLDFREAERAKREAEAERARLALMAAGEQRAATSDR